ncbi:amino acid transporter [Antarcticirhabdus aurantiaca]|uniref:Amino acid transporter n=1 Tax=Antarcticirhabdus aurantiaca TaxID=2606717 RepID=A0ACD4NU57_9HYPH|nr:amino acid transporter [Antarcticirhabdus aurantiaca]WAJ30397.1 amino acid transporter [Jeongeuplla avenae]
MSDPAGSAAPADPKRPTEAETERIKLSACFMNGVAIAILAIGGLAPFFSCLYGSTPSPQSLLFLATVGTVCAPTSVAPRLAARHTLNGLLR